MNTIKFFNTIDYDVLDELLSYHNALAKSNNKTLFQLNIFCSEAQFDDYINPNFEFGYELHGEIKLHKYKVIFPLKLYTLTYKDIKFNFVVSDYYIDKYVNIKAEPVYNEKYNAIKEFIIRERDSD